MTMNFGEQVAQRIQASGGRMTTQRQVILETLEHLGGHPTAEEIHASVQAIDASINLSTVYRTLRWLEDHGLIHPRFFEEGRRQQRFDPAPADNHYHFRCISCNQIIEFSDPLVEQIQQGFGSRYQASVSSATLVLYGVCAECRTADQP